MPGEGLTPEAAARDAVFGHLPDPPCDEPCGHPLSQHDDDPDGACQECECSGFTCNDYTVLDGAVAGVAAALLAAEARGREARDAQWAKAIQGAANCVAPKPAEPGFRVHDPVDRPRCGCSPLRALLGSPADLRALALAAPKAAPPADAAERICVGSGWPCVVPEMATGVPDTYECRACGQQVRYDSKARAVTHLARSATPARSAPPAASGEGE